MTSASNRTWVRLVATLMLVASIATACADESATTTTAAATTTRATSPSTTAASTGSTTIPKSPAATIDALVAALYAAFDAHDNAAFQALSVDGARHGLYYAQSISGVTAGGAADDLAIAELDIAASDFPGVEVLGEPIVSGNAVAIPVAYVYPDEVDTGFDLMIVTEVDGGYLFAGGVTFYAAPGTLPGAQSDAVIEGYTAAWNEGTVADVVAFLDDAAALWDSIVGADSSSIYRGEALTAFIASSLWFEVEITSAPIPSGPFLAVPNRLSTAADESEGISIFLLRDGKVFLHAFGQ